MDTWTSVANNPALIEVLRALVADGIDEAAVASALSTLRVYVLNDYLSAMPLGSIGEVYVSGHAQTVKTLLPCSEECEGVSPILEQRRDSTH